MNNRLKELYTEVVGRDKLAFDSYLAEKFAELIVKECVDVVLAPHNEAMMSVSMDLCKFSTREAINRAAQKGGLKVHTQGIANQIKEHFGVGE